MCAAGYESQCTLEMVVGYIFCHALVLLYICCNGLIKPVVRTIWVGCKFVLSAAGYVIIQMLRIKFAGAFLILVGFAGSGMCDGIPSLPTYCAVIGICMVLHDAIELLDWMSANEQTIIAVLGPRDQKIFDTTTGRTGVVSTRLIMSCTVMGWAAWGWVRFRLVLTGASATAVPRTGTCTCILWTICRTLACALMGA
eukprot:226080-Prymnesium_polylepis.2